MRTTESVPGAYVLTSITTKHPVVPLSLHLIRYQLIFQFNGKIADTLAAINYFIGQDGISRASINTLSASAAIIFYQGTIIGKRYIHHQRSNKEKRTLFAVNQISVLTHPAQSTFNGPATFQHRSGINQSSALYVADFFPHLL